MTPKTRFVASAVLIAASLCLLSLWPPSKAPEPESWSFAEQLGNATQSDPAPLRPGQLVLAANAAANPRSSPSEALPTELPHPHPITPQHERIYRENHLTFELDGAVDVEDVAGIRRLLATYRQEFPEDSLVLQAGYEIIADCLETPGATTRAAAQRFYDTELASALRRHVRRHCLERS